MAELRIEMADGRAQVFELRPALVATFESIRQAELYVEHFNLFQGAFGKAATPDFAEAARAEFGAAAEAEPRAEPTPEAEPEPQVEPDPTPATDPRPADQAPAAETPAEPEQGWTKAELAAAFERLGAGEKLKAVAADFGKSINKLRGKWAHHCRRNRAGAPPPPRRRKLCAAEPGGTGAIGRKAPAPAAEPVDGRPTRAGADRKPLVEARANASRRKCLTCGKSFRSVGPGNRLCPTCRPGDGLGEDFTGH